MKDVSQFEILVGQIGTLREKIKRYILEMERMVHLIDTHIEIEEKRTGIDDPSRSDYSATARQLKARRENMTATISDLGKTLTRPMREAQFNHRPTGSSSAQNEVCHPRRASLSRKPPSKGIGAKRVLPTAHARGSAH